MTADSRPILWQLEISHYNEKVRWALDYKRIPHVRKSLLPGPHRVKVLRLTRGKVKTTPLVTFPDGVSIGDSTQILAALETRYPDPPLYPADAAERRRAIELEEWFDEELGVDLRRALYHELLKYPELVKPLFTHNQPPASRALIHLAFPLLKVGIRRDMNIYEDTAQESRAKMLAALAKLEDELQPSGYLVGDSFTVADLTAAALFYPLAGPPPEYPYPTVTWLPPRAEEFLAEVAGRPGVEWIAEMYRRHRHPEGAIPTPAQPDLSSASAGSS